MRVGVLTACGIAASIVAVSSAAAEPRFEVSAFGGIGWFSDDTELGNSAAPEQVPGTSAIVGGRLGWIALPSLIDAGDTRLQLGVEAELSIAPAMTGQRAERRSHFAPVFGWRGHVIARLVGLREMVAHVVIGAGGETVASSSPHMAKETDAIAYWGLGGSTPISSGWHLRLDVRHGIMAGRMESTSQTFEVQLGLATTFGPPVRPITAKEPDPPPVTVVEDTDRDRDGLPDRVDRCPAEPESVNGIDDGDGCPEPDSDADGVLGDADSCPAVPEDLDHFNDSDGCPDFDNDGDRFEDARDTCPLAPETRNGFTDDDGCPDQLPEPVAKALAEATAIVFDATRARVSPAAKTALRSLLAVLRQHPKLRIAIVSFPPTAAGGDLAKRRAEAVKWHLVDEGIAPDRIETSIGQAAPGAISVKLIVP